MKEKKLVLIVDDNNCVAATIEQFMTMTYRDKLDCRSFTDDDCGHDTLDWLEDHTPDIAILDILLNGVNGFDIIDKIKEKKLDTRILIISGCDEHSKEIEKAAELVCNNGNIHFATKMRISNTLRKEFKDI